MADARRAPLKDQTDISGARALIVEARFYDDIQDALLEGAVAELKAAGVTHEVITVPGSLEIPAAIAIALDAAENHGKPYDAVIALGCVVRGDTIHFEIVSMESSRALMDLAIARRIPLGNGIITVAVTDHGKGIPAQEQSRIFERLYRSPSVEHQMPGSGLGLSIAQNIVRAHHGDLTVTSRPGETTFRLTLPLEQKGARK